MAVLWKALFAFGGDLFSLFVIAETGRYIFVNRSTPSSLKLSHWSCFLKITVERNLNVACFYLFFWAFPVNSRKEVLGHGYYQIVTSTPMFLLFFC